MDGNKGPTAMGCFGRCGGDDDGGGDSSFSGKGFEDLMTMNLARYKPTEEFVAVRRINLEACTNEMVAFLQVQLAILCLASLAYSSLRH